MLILSRKTNEKIMIGDDISITVIEIRGDQIRVGVDAPKHVKVYRQEVFDLVKAENQAAAAAAAQMEKLPELGINAVREKVL
ncbi:MAG: carbon storage regulator CsrA [Spirochaetaceae bacterium]|jgi:carbon storage regulator|nr:carbon storage regulator CsrA [Spirochaetaceae bacterium]